jgi:hypothetical protein
MVYNPLQALLATVRLRLDFSSTLRYIVSSSNEKPIRRNTMIEIYRGTYEGILNHFHGRTSVSPDEVKVITKSNHCGSYTFAQPSQKGNWAFGGTMLYTSNGIHSKFNTPIKLHDRNMDMER